MMQEAVEKGEKEGRKTGREEMLNIDKWLNDEVSEEEIVQRLNQPQEDCKETIDRVRKRSIRT